MQKRAYHDFPLKVFFVSQYQKTSYANPSVFQKNSGIEKFLGKREEGGITMSRRFFCVRVPQNFVGELFGVSEKFWYPKKNYS